MADRHGPGHRGYTLIELLVVIGVVMVLAGLALPAVQGSIERARRLDCQSRLAQIGRALNAHVAGHSAYPYVADTRSPESPRWPLEGEPWQNRAYGPWLGLLPHLDQVPLANAFNVSVPAGGTIAYTTTPHPANTTVAGTRLAIFLCPSDPARPDQPERTLGGTSYRYNLGPTTFTSLDGGRPIAFSQTRRGAFVRNRALWPSKFPDGLARTAFASERPRGAGTGPYMPVRDFWMSPALPTSQEELVNACSALRGEPPYYSSLAGRSWLLPGQRSSAYGHDLAPNSAIPDCSVSWNDRDDADVACITARSFHDGGVNVLYGDGHVEFVTDAIEVAVWRALGTRNGGEAIP